jgi:cytochrome P450
MTADHRDLFRSHFSNFHQVNARARAEQPVAYSDTYQAWVVTRYHDVRHVLSHPRLFSSANAVHPIEPLSPECLKELERGYPPTAALVNTDGAEHRRIRRPFAKYLELRRIRELEPFIGETAGELVEAMLAAGSAEFMRQFAEPLQLRVTSRLVGLDPADERIARESSAASSRLFRRSNMDTDEQLGYVRQIIRFQRLLAGLIEKRRAEPRDDLISFVVAELAPGDAPLGYEATRELIWSLAGIFGGQGSAAAALGMALFHLLSNRDQWETLVARPDLARHAVEELCRYDGPAQTFRRVTTEAVTVGDVELPAGAEVMGIIGAANRDEALVDRPNEFDITRPRMRHLAFGLSSHICVGAALARAQLRITLSTLARRLPGLHLTDGHPIQMDPVINHRKPLELHLSWSA